MSLIASIKELHAERRLKYVDLARACLLPSSHTEEALQSAQQRLARWLNHAEEGEIWKRINEDQFRKIYAFVYQTRRQLGASHANHDYIQDAMFYGLIAWLGCDADNLRDLRESFAGDYTIYRHSFSAVGLVGIGRLKISCDNLTGAVKCKEEYRLGSAIDGSHAVFVMEGYLIRKSGRHYIFSRHDDGPSTFLQFLQVDALMRRGGNGEDRMSVVAMSGALSDVQDRSYYSCRFSCVRGAPRELSVTALNDVPPSVRRELEKPVQIARLHDGAIGHVFIF